MKTVTKAQRAKWDKLQEARSVAVKAIYAAAPNDQTRFSDCVLLASEEVVKAYKEASTALNMFEINLVSEGRAWRNSFGHVYPY